MLPNKYFLKSFFFYLKCLSIIFSHILNQFDPIFCLYFGFRPYFTFVYGPMQNYKMATSLLEKIRKIVILPSQASSKKSKMILLHCSAWTPSPTTLVSKITHVRNQPFPIRFNL